MSEDQQFYEAADAISADAPSKRHTVGVLPQVLIDSIGEYGLARTDGVSELERQHRWEVLIAAIKTYAQREVDAAVACTDVPKPSMEAGEGVGSSYSAPHNIHPVKSKMRSPAEVTAELRWAMANSCHEYARALKWVLREEG